MRDIKKPLTPGWECLYGIGPTSVRSVHEPLHQRNGAAPRRRSRSRSRSRSRLNDLCSIVERLKVARTRKYAVGPSSSNLDRQLNFH
jgi:hypothetical protein